MFSIRRVDFMIALLYGKPFHVHSLQDVHVEAPRLRGHALGKFLSADALREAGKVIQAGRNPGCPAETGAFDPHIRAFARGIDGRGETCWSSTDDDQIVVGFLGYST